MTLSLLIFAVSIDAMPIERISKHVYVYNAILCGSQTEREVPVTWIHSQLMRNRIPLLLSQDLERYNKKNWRATTARYLGYASILGLALTTNGVGNVGSKVIGKLAFATPILMQYGQEVKLQGLVSPVKTPDRLSISECTSITFFSATGKHEVHTDVLSPWREPTSNLSAIKETSWTRTY